MRRIPVLQIGVGGVGQALIDQILWFNEQLGNKVGFRFSYIGLADRTGAIVADERIPPAVLRAAAQAKRDGGSLVDMQEGGPLNDWRSLLTPMPCLVVDLTAQDQNEIGLVEAIEQGHRVVLANKKPLCAGSEAFQALTREGRTRYEATVGAGLPIISTLRSLVETGDVVERIEGCFSGTLGFLMTQLEAGVAFSEAVLEAKARGWTEPDPRDDLSGTDVARKALILARTSGFDVEFEDVQVEALYPGMYGTLSPDEFMERLHELDESYHDRFRSIDTHRVTLRYIAQTGADNTSVSLREVTRDHPTGELQGPDNLVVFHTQRYKERSLSVRGPGAGVEVTASAVLHDMIAFAREWR